MTTKFARAFTASLLVIAGSFGSYSSSGADQATAAASPTVAELMIRNLDGTPDKQAVMIEVTYPPGSASLAHRHDAPVFVYVLEGTLTMQVDGSAPVTISSGQTFYEGPNDVHRLSANASQTEPAKILVFMIKDKGKPISRAVAPKETP